MDDRKARSSRQSKGRRRANALDGKTWTRYSISVWSDIKKTAEENALKHPAMFPIALAQRVCVRSRWDSPDPNELGSGAD